jgi:hypothetical protein
VGWKENFMRFVLVLALSVVSTAALAAPVNTAKDAIKNGCDSIHKRLPGDTGNCGDLLAVLRGDVWTISEKPMPSNIVGGGAPVVEVSQETGEVLNFYLTE